MARPLRGDHPVYNLPGAKLDRFGYRRFARKILGDLKGSRLKGIKAGTGDRVGVFYSREDLSAGIVGEPIDGIIGYDVATATAIMRNIALYAAANSAPAPVATTPTPKPAEAPKKADEPLPF
jgi:hypothetical protein